MRGDVFTDRPMSPSTAVLPPPSASAAIADRLALSLGIAIREERLRRRWSVRELARRAGLGPSAILKVEAGRHSSLTTYARIVAVFGLDLEAGMVDRRRKPRPTLDEDPVHAAMGELEAGHLRSLGYEVSIDEPYQHYQFAGRADVIARRLGEGALLHIENRTRFPNLGEAAGSYNAKRAYLAPVIAKRLGLPGFQSVTHAMVGLWSAEVMHSLRLRSETFRSLCPDEAATFHAWWAGAPPITGITSTFVLLDPFARERQAPFANLGSALDGLRPRVGGYAEAAARLRAKRTGS
jgi:transcriptional regulator with XRE-family HTH domain